MKSQQRIQNSRHISTSHILQQFSMCLSFQTEMSKQEESFSRSNHLANLYMVCHDIPIHMWWLGWLFPESDWLVAGRCWLCCCLSRLLWLWGQHRMHSSGRYSLKWCRPGPGPARWPDSPSAGLHRGRLGDSRSGGIQEKEEGLLDEPLPPCLYDNQAS